MDTECYPISILPSLSRLFLDFTDRREALAPFYPASAYSARWMAAAPALSASRRATLCDLLDEANPAIGPSGPAFAKCRENILKLRAGASAVVTGQQVTLFGGPVFTLLKAATVIRKAKDASASGRPHVPIFWMATEDHDFFEANHVTLPAGNELRTLRLNGDYPPGAPVGGLVLGEGIEEILRQAEEILGPGPLLEDLALCYRAGASFGEAFAGLLRRVYAVHGLIVLDASSRAFHALGSGVLREAIVRAEELYAALTDRSRDLVAAGYHSQVLVPPQSSLLFLIDRDSGMRQPLRRSIDGAWTAARQTFSTADLLAILETEPERLSPNALLRPVFQDSILPTAVYVGGPSEIAYFAQSQVLYERILGSTTPILPRLSATLIEPAVAKVLAEHELSLPAVIEASSQDALELAQRLGARALPMEAKGRMAAAGDALETELQALTAYMHSLDGNLGRASDVAASKMRYQMNRLHRMAANYQLQREQSLLRHARAIELNLFPDRHPQERVFGGAWFLSRYGKSLPDLLIGQAGQQCPGHKVVWL